MLFRRGEATHAPYFSCSPYLQSSWHPGNQPLYIRNCHLLLCSSQVVREGFNPEAGLFRATTDNRLYPNPHAQVGRPGCVGVAWRVSTAE